MRKTVTPKYAAVSRFVKSGNFPWVKTAEKASTQGAKTVVVGDLRIKILDMPFKRKEKNRAYKKQGVSLKRGVKPESSEVS